MEAAASFLRQEWGFNGFITSDGDGLQMLVNTHHVAATKADAARLAVAVLAMLVSFS